MSESRDELNFVRAAKLILDLVPAVLREVFRSKWNAQYPAPHSPWCDDAKFGELFHNGLIDDTKKEIVPIVGSCGDPIAFTVTYKRKAAVQIGLEAASKSL